MIRNRMEPIGEWLTQRFELARVGVDARNVRSMEGMRGFAVFLVFLIHYVALVRPWIPADSWLQGFSSVIHSMGSTGVDLFFVLSGYLIYGAVISRQQNFVKFMFRRIRRIYPTFTAVFLAYIALSYAFPAENRIPAEASAAVAYLLANFLLLPGFFDMQPMITVAWSLSYEMFYYLMIPLLVEALGLRSRSPGWRVGFFSALAIGFTLYCFLAGGPYRLVMFMAGILLFETLQARSAWVPGNQLGVLALIVGLLITSLPMHFHGSFLLKFPLLFLSFFVLCLACFQDADQWLARAFAWTPLRWLGNMSYSYYLLHSLALKAAFMVFGRIVPTEPHDGLFWALILPMFVLTLLPSAILFLAVERPFSLAPQEPRRHGQVAEN